MYRIYKFCTHMYLYIYETSMQDLKQEEESEFARFKYYYI